MEGPGLPRSAAPLYRVGPRVWQRRRRRAELRRVRREQACVGSGVSNWTYLAHYLAGEAVPHMGHLLPSATHPKHRFKGNPRMQCEAKSGLGSKTLQPLAQTLSW